MGLLFLGAPASLGDAVISGIAIGEKGEILFPSLEILREQIKGIWVMFGKTYTGGESSRD